MRIVTWNVNSIRARRSHVKQLLSLYKPSVLAMQEIKVVSNLYPHDLFKVQCAVNGQPAYNGVATYTKSEHQDVQINPFDDETSRVVACTYKNIRFINVYVPNGGKDPDAYLAKLDWLSKLLEYAYEQQRHYKNIVILGDFNICPRDTDVYDPVAWAESITCTEAERAFYLAMTNSGFHDAWLVAKNAAKDHYTWWDYRFNAARKDNGLRIDLMLLSDNLTQYVKDCRVLREYRFKDQPSDHAPVMLTIEK